MRYFLTMLADRPVVAGGKAFNFEPVGNRGGSWLGVLAVDDESDANSLAGSASHTLEEISLEQYEVKKKALTATPNASPASTRLPPSNPLDHVVADRAGSTSPTFVNNGGPNSTAGISAVTILTTPRQPPAEAILDAPSTGRRS